MSQERDELTDLLRELQRLPAFLAYSQRSNRLQIWAPGVRVPPELRRQVNVQQAAILARMRQADASTCTDPDLHRRSWRWDRDLGGVVCEMCELMDSKVV